MLPAAVPRVLSKHFEATQALLRDMAKQIEAHEAFVEDLLHLDLKDASRNACCNW